MNPTTSPNRTLAQDINRYALKYIGALVLCWIGAIGLIYFFALSMKQLSSLFIFVYLGIFLVVGLAFLITLTTMLYRLYTRQSIQHPVIAAIVVQVLVNSSNLLVTNLTRYLPISESGQLDSSPNYTTILVVALVGIVIWLAIQYLIVRGIAGFIIPKIGFFAPLVVPAMPSGTAPVAPTPTVAPAPQPVVPPAQAVTPTPPPEITPPPTTPPSA